MLSFDRYYARRLHKQEKAAADLEMTAMEKFILRELAKGGGTVAWLSERLELDAGYVSRTVTVLELNRQVTRCRAPHDGRQREIQLTDWGRRVVQDLEELQEQRTRDGDDHRGLRARWARELPGMLSRAVDRAVSSDARPASFGVTLSSIHFWSHHSTGSTATPSR